MGWNDKDSKINPWITEMTKEEKKLLNEEGQKSYQKLHLGEFNVWPTPKAGESLVIKNESDEVIEVVQPTSFTMIDTPKPFGDVMREFNESAKTLQSIDQAIEKAKIILGIDEGSKAGDKAIVSIIQDGKYNIIGESIELSIPEGWNTKVVKAIQIGDLAVVMSEGEEHCIAHVPTQTWFDNAIPDGSYSVEQYCLWAWKVQQDYKNLWEYCQRFTNINYKEIGNDILKDIQQHCLSIKVEND